MTRATVALLTDDLTGEYEKLLSENGYECLTYSPYQFSPIESNVKDFTGKVVFTSKRAVQYFPNISSLQNCLIFCMGSSAGSLLRKHGMKDILGEHCKNAAELASFIHENYFGTDNRINFCCGKDSLDVLPTFLRERGWTVSKTVLYSKNFILSYDQIEALCTSDVIVLFNPLIVDQLKNSLLSCQGLILAIGRTTADYARKQGINIAGEMEEPKGISLIRLLDFIMN